MPTPPYESPANVQSAYQGFGDIFARLGKNLSIGVEDLQKDMQRRDFVKRTYDALNQSGFKVQPRPDETAAEAGSRAAGLGLLKEVMAKWKAQNPGMLTVDMSKYADVVTDFNSGYKISEDLDKKMTETLTAKKGEQASGLAADVFTKGGEQQGPVGYMKALAEQPGGAATVQMGAQKPYLESLEAQARRQTAMEAAANRANTPRPKSGEDITRQLEQDVEDGETKLTALIKSEEAQWDAVDAAKKEWQKWKKQTENSMETMVQYSPEKDAEFQAKIKKEKDRAIDLQQQKVKQQKRVREMEAKIKKTVSAKEKKGTGF